MSYIIVENDFLYAERIKVILAEAFGADDIYVFDNVKETLAFCQNHTPEIIICDIFLEGNKTGLDLLDVLRDQHIPIVMMTSSVSPEFYEIAKQIKHVNYLIKPIQALSLISTIEKLLNETGTSPKEDGLFVKGNHNKHIKVLFDEILWIESEGNYSTIVTKTKKYTLKQPLKNLIVVLDDRFERCHQRYLVNLNLINSHSQDLLHIESFTIPLGRTFRLKILDRLAAKK
ncbi:DNA-binding response regulator, LytR/AlgR family [Pseudarcicella hirudinis]|uniref:DNA-binding response regulator, LytR/AlgR family n=1 Tax=Pseudarcicella hirudinis TaxID=1079859 RepID=A0A1I5U6R7_9BACT|nr:response regulator transcription factor [Pseudarcicella hirudinis]SFP90627.1 DNA-binding response regulator, LytR/AlgR family [Pseudarcicella hirudinis]